MRALQIALVFAAVCLAAIFTSPNDVKAWGKFGHLTVCDLAYRNFTDKTREELKKLFQVPAGITVAGRGEMEDRHYTSFNVGCLEAA